VKRAQWNSRLGFMWSAIGSAIGLGSIWRFPYVVGENGGAAFVLIFCICLVLVSLPVLMTEILIGRKSATSPFGAFKKLGGNNFWGGVGKMTIVTGFLVSSFYSVIAGWTLGYLVEAIFGHVMHFATATSASAYFAKLSSSPVWALGYHFFFMVIAVWILFTGVQRGIERGNKILMPMLFLILVLLVAKGLMLPNAQKGVAFLLSPDWSSVTPAMVLMALGQAFFGVSLGQGTMVTYGSYLSKDDDIPLTCFPIACSVIVVSILAGLAIFSVVFSVGMAPSAGPDLMFKTLPVVLSQITGGYFFGVLFFLLIFLAALTSQISAMEPTIAYLIDEKRFTRHQAVSLCGVGSLLLGVPSALSFGLLKNKLIFGLNFFDFISFISINILIPLGGLAAVIVVGWVWGVSKGVDNMKKGAEKVFKYMPFLAPYLKFSIKYLAPFIILVVLANLLFSR